MRRILEETGASGRKPRLLLQACCGPCSASSLEQLGEVFQLTILYYNPNTWPEAEFLRREAALEMVLARQVRPPELLVPTYDHGEFLAAARGLEKEPKGGARCEACWHLRLERTAQIAAEKGFEWIGTTLTVGPTKKAAVINPIGEALAAEYGLRWLPADFKKGGGYQRSLELSREMGLYRQDYCGCEFAPGGRGAQDTGT